MLLKYSGPVAAAITDADLDEQIARVKSNLDKDVPPSQGGLGTQLTKAVKRQVANRSPRARVTATATDESVAKKLSAAVQRQLNLRSGQRAKPA